MSYKVMVSGREVIGLLNENQWEGAPEGSILVESTYEEYLAAQETFMTLVKQSKCALWINGAIVEETNTDPEYIRRRGLMIEETKIQYGIKVRALLGFLCEQNNFTPTEYGQMLADSNLSTCSALLVSGALESCKGIIDSYTPTAYFTQTMKDAMSAELTKYITLVAGL